MPVVVVELLGVHPLLQERVVPEVGEPEEQDVALQEWLEELTQVVAVEVLVLVQVVVEQEMVAQESLF
jgi:hypothetical protein